MKPTMPSTQTARQSQPCNAGTDILAKRITEILTAPATDGSVAGPTVRRLRKQLKTPGMNRAAHTVATLLTANKRHHELHAALAAHLDEPRADNIPLPLAIVRETEIESPESCTEAHVLSGDESGPELRALIRESRDHVRALQALIAAAETQLERLSTRRAA